MQLINKAYSNFLKEDIRTAIFTTLTMLSLVAFVLSMGVLVGIFNSNLDIHYFAYLVLGILFTWNYIWVYQNAIELHLRFTRTFLKD